jgi:hypothetical protein
MSVFHDLAIALFLLVVFLVIAGWLGRYRNAKATGGPYAFLVFGP